MTCQSIRLKSINTPGMAQKTVCGCIWQRAPVLSVEGTDRVNETAIQ